MTQDIQNMRQTRPQPQTLFDQGVLAECFDYDQVCTACADAC